MHNHPIGGGNHGEVIQELDRSPNQARDSRLLDLCERQLHCFSKTLYKHRNLVELFFNKIKYFKRLTTRYDKLGSCFLAMLKLAAIRLWLRHNESTA